MATIKKASKVKNLSAGPSKMTKKAGPVDPKGQYTKVQERTLGSMKMGGTMKKGGSFPDLNKDGKVTQKDILIGKGVLPKTAKKGMKLKKQAAVAIAMKKAGKAPKKMMQYGGAAASMVPPMKMGGTLTPTKSSVGKTIGKLNKAKAGAKMTKKCAYGCK